MSGVAFQKFHNDNDGKLALRLKWANVIDGDEEEMALRCKLSKRWWWRENGATLQAQQARLMMMRRKWRHTSNWESVTDDDDEEME